MRASRDETKPLLHSNLQLLKRWAVWQSKHRNWVMRNFFSPVLDIIFVAYFSKEDEDNVRTHMFLQRPWAWDTWREHVCASCSSNHFWQKEKRGQGKDELPRSQSTIYIYEVFQELNMTEVTQISRRATSSRVGKVHNRVSVPCHYRLSLEQGWWEGTSLIRPCQPPWHSNHVFLVITPPLQSPRSS